LFSAALDALTVTSIATMDFPAFLGRSCDHCPADVAFAVIVLACVAWDLVALFVLAPFLVPNYWYERGIAEIATSTGDVCM
jgi:Na+/glutamate symporter